MVSCSITTLPDDVLFRVFALCNGDDLHAFSEVNRNFRVVAQDDFLWRVIYRRRFGEEPGSRAWSYQEQYNDRNCLILSVANKCEIIHGHLPHWRFLTDPRSIFGKVALLEVASWLHVQGRLQGVHSGTYRVIWRLFVLPQARNIFAIRFRAKAAQRQSIAAQLPFSSSLLEFGSDYFDFVLPEVLVVKAPFESVLFECIDTSQVFKTNIGLCSVRLEPIGDSPRARRARTIVGVEPNMVDKERFEKPTRRHEIIEIKLITTVLAATAAAGTPTYRPWQPRSKTGWAETWFMSLFCLLLAILFAYLLFDKTRS